GKSVYPNAEPRNPVASGDTHDAKGKNDRQRYAYRLVRYRGKDAEVEDDDDGNEAPQEDEKLSLRDQIRLAGLVNEFRDLPHGAVDGQVLQLGVDNQTKKQAEDAEENSE